MSAPTTSADPGIRSTGAHAILEALVRGGVRHLHGVPGHGAYPIYDALHDVAGIDPVVARHEQGAGFAAVGEAWAGGGVAAATSVPRAGLANSATPLMEATASQDRILFLVEEEAGQEGLAGAVAHRHVRVGPGAALGQVVDELLERLASERPGAVVLEIPAKALAAPAPGDRRAAMRPSARRAAAVDVSTLSILAGARRPLILASATALASAGGPREASNPAMRLAEALGAPLIADGFAPGLLPRDHPLAIPSGWSPHGPAAELVTASDAIVVIGTPLAGAQNAPRWNDAILAATDPARRVFVDWDDRDQQSVPAASRLRGHVPSVVDALASALPSHHGSPAPGWSAGQLDEARAVVDTWLTALPEESQRWLTALCSSLPRDGVVVADSLLGVWLHRLLAPPGPRRLRHPWGTGTLGAALPAAIGAKLARPDAEVTALAGDGAFLYSATELAALRALGLRITVVVANDNAFGAVRDNLRHSYGRSGVHQLTNPSFPDLARAFGLVGVRCDRPEQLDAVLATARAGAKSTLVEIPLILHPPREAFA